jgi:hypothetical protein
MTLDQEFEVEDKVVHAIDVSGLGLVTWNAGNDYVTPNSYLPPYTSAPSIQRGINAASDGWTVNVQGGTYNEAQIAVNKPLTILGNTANPATTVIDGGGGTGLSQAGLVRITAAGNVTFRGFTVQGAGTDGSGVRVGI